MAKSKRAKPELKVVFETSALFTKVAYELLSSEVRKLIESNSQHPDLSTKWYLPGVVVDERRYQMQRKAFELLPSVSKLERLLNHNLNITEDILKSQVNDAIEKQLSELSISTLDIDTSQVDWNSLINRAVFRLSPFEPGDKEKGFRDSLIAETFLQLVNQSPTTPSICRLAIVTNDGLLSEYVKSSTEKAKNIRILSAVGELESLINTLVSKVTEKFIADIQGRIQTYFFDVENKTGLFFKENITDKIKELYDKELDSVPKEDLQRENGTWFISEPVFLKKERQRTFWMNFISVEAKLFKYELPTIPTPSPSDATWVSSFMTPLKPKLSIAATTSPSILGDVIKTNFANGKTIFKIHWSVNITQRKKFTHPRIEEIKFIDTIWEQK